MVCEGERWLFADRRVDFVTPDVETIRS